MAPKNVGGALFAYDSPKIDALKGCKTNENILQEPKPKYAHFTGANNNNLQVPRPKVVLILWRRK
jgi:hypothetical protein